MHTPAKLKAARKSGKTQNVGNMQAISSMIDESFASTYEITQKGWRCPLSFRMFQLSRSVKLIHYFARCTEASKWKLIRR